MTKLGVLLLIFQLAVVQLVAGTSYEDCEVYFLRIQNPPLEVNSWDCVCKPSGDNMPVATGLVNNFYLANDTSLETMWYQISCFNKAYHEHNLKSLCQSDAEKFMEVTKPLIDQCLEEAKKFSSVPGPFPYSRDNCNAYFTEGLNQGPDAAAAFWMCQCPQPQWQVPGFPMPSVIDGRAMYPVTKTPVTNFMRKCTAAYGPIFNHICRSHIHYTHFRDLVQEVYKQCCVQANSALGLSMNCPAINLSEFPTRTIQSYPQHGLPGYGNMASFGY